MVLARHIDAEEVVQQCKVHHHTKHVDGHDQRIYHQTPTRDVAQDIPKYTLPKSGVAASAAYQMIHDEMALDGTPVLNLASFVHTWMPPEADKLIMENLNKNAVDMDEYPATQVMQARCVSMIADLWKVPKGSKAIGTATAGSSEAIMLGGLAMKKAWQAKRIAAGKDHFHPNIVFGANAQVALEKFARYFDVECRLVPVTEESDFVMDPAEAMQFIDENTIGVMVILGSTYTGAFEDVQKMSDLLDEYEKKTGLSIPIHVDAASGGFVAPFAYPNLKWSFDVPRVVSINTSGHKYGGVYVGLGWIIWKDESLLPKELIFELHYLGSTEYSYTLNFSHPAFPVISQMFNFLNLGYEGYQTIALRDLANARLLSRALESTYFKVLSNIHKPLKKTAGIFDKALATLALAETDEALQCTYGLPVVAFRFSDAFKAEYPHVQQVWVQTLLRGRGWIVPNYNAPHKEEKVEILRVVVRETMSADLVERLIKDILEVTESLMGQTPEFAMMATTAAVSAAAKLEHAAHGKGNASTRPDVGHARMNAKHLPKRQVTLAMQC